MLSDDSYFLHWHKIVLVEEKPFPQWRYINCIWTIYIFWYFVSLSQYTFTIIQYQFFQNTFKNHYILQLISVWKTITVWDVSNLSWILLIFTDFELLAKRGEKFICFTLFRNFKELFISQQPDIRFDGGSPSCSILNG